MMTEVVASPRTLRHLVKKFRERNPGVEHPDTCRDRCMDYCDAWLTYLRSWIPNHEGEIVSGVKFGELPEFPGKRLIVEGHFGVLIDDLVYDWTARQFDPNAAVPKITPLAEWREEWQDLRRVDAQE